MTQRWGFTLSRRSWRLAALALGIIVCGSIFAVLLLWGRQPEAEHVRGFVGPSEQAEGQGLLQHRLSFSIGNDSGAFLLITAAEFMLRGSKDWLLGCDSNEKPGTPYVTRGFYVGADAQIVLSIDNEPGVNGWLSIFTDLGTGEERRFGVVGYQPSKPGLEQVFEVWGRYPPSTTFRAQEAGKDELAEVGPPPCATMFWRGGADSEESYWQVLIFGEEDFAGIANTTHLTISGGQGSIQFGGEPTAISPISTVSLKGNIEMSFENRFATFTGDAKSVAVNSVEQLPPRWGFATQFAQDLALVMVSALVGIFVGYLLGGRERGKGVPPD
jgi:hypothetical protein